jgi:hypothetical protein
MSPKSARRDAARSAKNGPRSTVPALQPRENARYAAGRLAIIVSTRCAQCDVEGEGYATDDDAELGPEYRRRAADLRRDVDLIMDDVGDEFKLPDATIALLQEWKLKYPQVCDVSTVWGLWTGTPDLSLFECGDGSLGQYQRVIPSGNLLPRGVGLLAGASPGFAPRPVVCQSVAFSTSLCSCSLSCCAHRLQLTTYSCSHTRMPTSQCPCRHSWRHTCALSSW